MSGFVDSNMLREMFPSLDISILNCALIDNNGDVALTIDQLRAYNNDHSTTVKQQHHRKQEETLPSNGASSTSASTVNDSSVLSSTSALPSAANVHNYNAPVNAGQIGDIYGGKQTYHINSHHLSLAESQKLFTTAIESIKYRMDPFDNGSRGQLDEANKMFENALKMLGNENIGKLANIIFTVDDRWSNNIVNKFDKAYDGSIEYWRDKHHKELKRGFDALQLAFLCDVFRRLFVDKQLKELKIDEYLSFILSQLIEYIREKEAEYYGELTHFVTVLLRFTDQPINKIVQKAFVNYRHELKSASEEKEDIEKIVVNWLIDVQTEDSLLQQPLIIICKPMALAESIIKELYRNKFEKYNPFYFSLGYKFEMKNWIPICLKVKGDSEKQENEWFQLVDQGLKTHGLVAIIGDPGVGKTILTKKMAFDFATSNSDNNKWINKYDIVLLAEFRATSDATVDNDIIGMALYGLKKMIDEQLSSSVSKFIKDNQDKCKLLIILDGYDEAMNRQCPQLDDVLHSNEQDRLPFDLIVTSRPSRVINRTEKITFLQIVGFDSDEKQHKYIEKHFERHEDKDNQIELVKSKIKKNSSYQEMAETPLLLTFICLVHSKLKQGTRVELYENVIQWFIRRKLTAFPNLLAELDAKENIFFGPCQAINAQKAKNIAENWFNLEQMQRLGYISLLYLEKKQYQFDHNELQLIQPNINIDVFAEIGLIISNTEGSIGNQIKKYQFAHRTLQEYFAAMFIVKWENEWIRNGIEYEKVKELWMWEENDTLLKMWDEYYYHRRLPFLAHIQDIQDINRPDEVSKFIIEILLAKRDSKYIQSFKQYLIKTTRISFDIHSNDIDESSKQINYINDILQKCSNIKQVIIDLHKISVNNTIKLHLLPNIDYIHVEILNGLFSNNQSNIISIYGPNKIEINIEKCNLSLSGLILFAEYINNNAERFKSIYFNEISLTETDMIDINKLKSIYFKQYCGDLSIVNLELDSTQSTEYINTYIIDLLILRLFFGIKELYLELPRNDEINDNSYLLQQSIEYSSDMTNLSELRLYTNKDNASIGKTYWTCINIILQKCPNIRKIVIGLSNISIDEPIDLHFLSLKHDIELDIDGGTFTDNDSNMICINDNVKQINIRFNYCKYSYRRLILFANYINQNSQLFNKIEFINVSDKDIFDAVLKYTKFDHFAIKQDKSDKYSIVKRQSSWLARLLSVFIK